jgi:Anabaena sensory rhodopsin transducer
MRAAISLSASASGEIDDDLDVVRLPFERLRHERAERAVNKRGGRRKVPIRELNGASVVFLCTPKGAMPQNRTLAGRGDIDMEPIGRKRWAIAEGFIPSQSSFSERTLVSHETACILNAGDRQAHVDITLFSPTASPSARIG